MRRAAMLAIAALALATVASAGGFGALDASRAGDGTALRAEAAPVPAVTPAGPVESGVERGTLDRTKWRWTAVAAAAVVASLLFAARFVCPARPARRLAPLALRRRPRAPPCASSAA